MDLSHQGEAYGQILQKVSSCQKCQEKNKMI